MPSTVPVAPLPVGESKRLHLAQIEIALSGGPHDRVGERMFAGALDAGCEPQDFALLKSGHGHDRDDFRLALGQRARLVDHQSIDPFHPLQRFRVPDQHAGLGAAPDADHDRHRCGKAERAGTGDDQHANCRNQAERHPGLRPEISPGAKSDDRNGDHRRHEPAGDLIGQPLDRRTRTLRLRHHLDDLGKQGVAADLVGAHHKAAGLVECARDHLAAGLFGDRHGFAGHQGFIERGAALKNDAVHRHLFSRPYAQFVACNQAVDLDLVVGAIIADTARGFGCQLQECLDRAGCRLAGAEFEDLAEKNKDRDDRGSLEVDRDRAAVSAEGCRKALRHDGSDDAVDVGHACAHRDQREHVEVARQQRLPAAHEERPARPDDDRSGEHELNPVRQGLIDPAMTADQVTAHFQDHRRQGEHEADPEPTRHVCELGIGRRIQARHLGLQRHAADRAASGTDLADLRVHRAGIDRAFRSGGFHPAFVEIGLRVGGEFGPAAGCAEMIGFAAVVEPMLACRRIDGHPADGIAHLRIADGAVVMVIVVGVIVATAAARLLRGRFGSGGFHLTFVEIGLRVGGKLGSAAGRAEMKSFAAIVEPMLARCGINSHPADRIACADLAFGLMAVTGAIVTSAATIPHCRLRGRCGGDPGRAAAAGTR